MSEPLIRAIIGALLSAGVAFYALQSRALSRNGAMGAVVSGTIAVAAGWRWGILLMAFFVSGIALSKLGARRKMEIAKGIVAKTGERDGWQVVANGGLFTAAALASLVSPAAVWPAIGIGALAASTADTWATEVGTLFGGEPRSIISGRRVAAGTSGGVTLAGSAASIGGAAFMAIVAALLEWPVSSYVIVVSGAAGALADSIAGALIQERRWCNACSTATEQTVHVCGTRTKRVGGIAGIDNDVVNLLCSFVGALVALLMA
ncbi:MAG: DUF92 domain-containing protein [Gemmatimonadaceae bacterium]